MRTVYQLGVALAAIAATGRYVPLPIELDHPVGRIAKQQSSTVLEDLSLSSSSLLRRSHTQQRQQQIVLVIQGGGLIADDLVPALIEQFPTASFGLVMFGNSTWRDQPAPPCGYWATEAFLNQDELRHYIATHNWSHTQRQGAPLNNFQSIIKATQFPYAQGVDRYVVHITHSEPRYFDDGGFNGSGLKQSAKNCRSAYDPSPYQVKSALLQRGCALITLVADTHYLRGPTGQAWSAFNRLLNQPDQLVNAVLPDYSDVPTKLSSALIVAKTTA